jgi:hypothetical protein
MQHMLEQRKVGGGGRTAQQAEDDKLMFEFGRMLDPSHSMRTSETHQRAPDGQRPRGANASNFVVPGVCVISMLLGACCLQLNAVGSKRAVGIRKKHRSVMQAPAGSDEESDLL